jgi:hypothetical protein
LTIIGFLKSRVKVGDHKRRVVPVDFVGWHIVSHVSQIRKGARHPLRRG